MKISIIIPVYNSENFTLKLIDKIEDVFQKLPYELEIILVDDGSTDNSWKNIIEIARKNSNYKGIKFLKNYGQHNAILCGLRHADGNFCITIDDDLQNPPEEIPKLIDHAIKNNNDLIFGKYIKKQSTPIRLIGSRFVSYCVNKIFLTKKNITNSNFRLIRQDVVERIKLYKIGLPYINGLALQNSQNPDNVLVEHNKRIDGKSTYTFAKILKLLSIILFNYSSLPLRFVTIVGIIFSLIGFSMGTYFLIDKFLNQGTYSGWASIFITLCFFSGLNLLILGILGEYVINVTNQTKNLKQYIVDEEINIQKK